MKVKRVQVRIHPKGDIVQVIVPAARGAMYVAAEARTAPGARPSTQVEALVEKVKKR